MEPLAHYTPSVVRNEKVKVLWSLKPITGADVITHTVRGQYAAGFSGGRAVVGYHDEAGAALVANTTSVTETFVAIRAEIDNWRWAGVPFIFPPANDCKGAWHAPQRIPARIRNQPPHQVKY